MRKGWRAGCDAKHGDGRLLLAAAAAVLLLPAAVRGQDAVTSIPERVLNQFAQAVGDVSGSEAYDVFLRLKPCVGCRRYLEAGRICLQFDLAPCRAYFFSLPWSWKVVAPRFEVLHAGIRFKGLLRVSSTGPAQFIPFDIPAAAQFDAASSSVRLTVANQDIPVTLNALGRVTSVGMVHVSAYYSTELPIAQRTISVSGRSVTGSVRNVSINLQPGALWITNDFQFN